MSLTRNYHAGFYIVTWTNYIFSAIVNDRFLKENKIHGGTFVTERTDTRISNKFAMIIMLVAFFAVCYAWSLQLNLGSIEKERERLKNENDSLQENTTQLNARISVVQNPWLPDTLVFANIKIPLTGPENWYIRSNLLASFRHKCPKQYCNCFY